MPKPINLKKYICNICIQIKENALLEMSYGRYDNSHCQLCGNILKRKYSDIN